MSFFKDLKEDIAQSVNELTETFDEEQAGDVADVAVEDFAVETPMPEDDGIEEPAMMFTKPADDADVAAELEEEPVTGADGEQSLEDLLSGVAAMPDITADEPAIEEETAEPEVEIPMVEEVIPEPEVEMPMVEEVVPEPVAEMPVVEEVVPEPVMEAPVIEETMTSSSVTEDISMTNISAESMEDMEMSTDEVTVITKGTTINGGIKSDTSLVVKGTIEGDVECAGKLTITGRVAGNTNASEIYVNTPRLEGDLNSKGIVKIDVGTVVIGGINSTSVVVAGAVKGNIEVNGPVIIDSTAVVKGDIKAKSIQINSGAVIDGHCSLQFADVDLDTFFE
ncbi:MAG: polymer-forming cytoskeletal protein [Eubacterium sp.]|nr:polymer-forming cytoskeletal protein [Eubacterium sp.]